MIQAVRIHAPGGPEQLRAEQMDTPAPGPDEVLISQSAIGVNYIDVYHRTGLYPLDLPAIIGMEGSGIVESTGANVKTLKIGDRVAYASGPVGAYAEKRVMPAGRVVKLPDTISYESAAAMMVKGMTAEYLLRRTYNVKKDDWILVHAAAGGVGQVLCQWGRHLGANIIATAGSDDKCALARRLGADHAINYRTENFKARVKDITNGQGVHVVYDGVGADTFMDSLDCLRPMGYMVSYGNASGLVPVIDPKILASKGSLFLTRPSLWHYTMTDEDYQASAKALFDVVQTGAVKIDVTKIYPLSDAAQAHRDLEGRATTGSVILIP